MPIMQMRDVAACWHATVRHAGLIAAHHVLAREIDV